MFSILLLLVDPILTVAALPVAPMLAVAALGSTALALSTSVPFILYVFPVAASIF